MTLQDMLDEAAKGETVTIADGWAQGRATYGGLVAALQLAAMKSRIDGKVPPLRSLTTNFVAPVEPAEVTIESALLRQGSNVTQCEARVVQGGRVAALAFASFGAGRRSDIRVHPHTRMPELPDPFDLRPLGHKAGRDPDFLRHMELRLVDGDKPFTGSDRSSFTGWMRLREPGPAFGEEHLVALADAWPVPVLQRLREPASASSVSWTLEVVGDMRHIAPTAQWAYAAHADAAADGYAHAEARIWRPHGTLTAISRQTVAVFG